jgi:flavin reductase (DIM6/NTAB) family NADH-FMN oxidoreductase RutF
MTIDSEQLRRAMRTWTTGVAVITALHDGQQYGMTVNSFSSVSLEPPLIGITLKQLTHTHELAVKAGEFSITILSSDQKELADRFAGKIADIKDRFEGLPTETLVIDAPLLGGGIAYFNCRIVNSIPIGENTFFLSEVIAASGEGKGEPLVYHNRVYWKLILPLSSPPISSRNLEESQGEV